MRSYSYTSGNWQICTTDTFPPTAPEASPYEYRPSPEWETFQVALHQRGFSSSSSHFTCLSGPLRLYVRDHNRLKAKQQDQEYDFLVVLDLADSWVRVWITDLPNALLFLREVGAQSTSSERSLAEVVDEAWHKMFHDEDVQHLLLTSGRAFAKLADGEVEITVKPPKQPRPIADRKREAFELTVKTRKHTFPRNGTAPHFEVQGCSTVLRFHSFHFQIGSYVYVVST